MKSRPVEIVICLETNATLKALRHRYYAAICDVLTIFGKYGRIIRVDVFTVKRLKAGTPGGGAS